MASARRTQELFRDALARECRRADRFGHPFALLLVELNPAAPTPSPLSAWMKAIEALTAAVGETAVLGWFESKTVFGAIVPDTSCGSIRRPSCGTSSRGGWAWTRWAAS